MNEKMDETMIEEFVVEAEEHLREIEPNLLLLEKHPGDLPILNDCFRNMHSIKGAAGYMGYTAISTLAHALENLFDRVRKGEAAMDGRAFELVFKGVDRIRTLVSEIVHDQGERSSADDILEALEHLSGSSGGSPSACGSPDASGMAMGAPGVEDDDLRSIFADEMRSLFRILTGISPGEQNVRDRLAAVLEDMERVLHYVGHEDERARVHAILKACTSDHEQGMDPHRVSDEIREIMEPLVGNLPADKVETGPSAAGSGVDEDEELYGIFLDFCREWTHVLGNVPEEPDGTWISMCQEGIQRIRSAAHYMDFPDMVQLMDECAERLAEGLTRHGDGSAFEPEPIRAIWRRCVDMFPGLSLCNTLKIEEDSISAPGEGGVSSGMKAFDSALDDLFSGVLPEAEVPDRVSGADPVGGLAGMDTEAGESAISSGCPIASWSNPPEKVCSGSPVSKEREFYPTHSKSVSQTVRVDLDKVERLMSEVSELVVLRSAFSQTAEELRALNRVVHVDHPSLAKALKPFKGAAARLSEQAASLGRIVQGLQDAVMQMRMLPVSHLFDRYPRLVRDLAQKLGKQVTLVVTGTETGLDKRIIEQMADPLLHIIRNSVDHGIEPPDVREKAGKTASGTLSLGASQEGNAVVIKIEDDGRGLDREALIRKAVSLGIVSRDAAQGLSDERVWDLMFLPGVSTAADVSEISGRGVGMHVVKKNIEKLGGTVRADSSPGKGTAITVRIPLTLAIIQALLARVGTHVMAIPLSSITETIRLRAEDVSPCEGYELISLRQKTVPLVRLGMVFRGTGSPAAPATFFAVMVVHDGVEAGLAVDGLIGRQDIVIQPLADYLTDQPGFSGATILGDGSIGLILDIPAVMERARSFVRRRHYFLDQQAIGVDPRVGPISLAGAI